MHRNEVDQRQRRASSKNNKKVLQLDCQVEKLLLSFVFCQKARINSLAKNKKTTLVRILFSVFAIVCELRLRK